MTLIAVPRRRRRTSQLREPANDSRRSITQRGLVAVVTPWTPGVSFASLRVHGNVVFAVDMLYQLPEHLMNRNANQGSVFGLLNYDDVTIPDWTFILGQSRYFGASDNDAVVMASSTGGQRHFFVDKNTGSFAGLSGTFPSAGTQSTVLTYPTGTANGSAYINGQLVAPLVSVGGARPFGTWGTRFLRARKAAAIAIFDRELEGWEAQSLHRNPWQLLPPELRRAWLNTAQAAVRSVSVGVTAAVRTTEARTSILTAAVQQQQQAQAALQAAVQELRAATAAAQAAVQTAGTSSASAGAAITLINSASAALQLAVLANGNASAGVSLQVQAGNTVSASLAAAILQQAVATASATLAVQAPRTATAALSAALSTAGQAAATIAAVVQELRGASASVSLQVQDGSSRSATLDLAVQRVLAAAAAVQVNVAAASTASAQVAAAVSVERSVSAALGAAVREGRAAGAGVSIYVDSGSGGPFVPALPSMTLLVPAENLTLAIGSDGAVQLQGYPVEGITYLHPDRPLVKLPNGATRRISVSWADWLAALGQTAASVQVAPGAGATVGSYAEQEGVVSAAVTITGSVGDLVPVRFSVTATGTPAEIDSRTVWVQIVDR